MPRLLRAEGTWEAAGSGYSLQVLAALVPRSAVGFPLLSLTQNGATNRILQSQVAVSHTFQNQRKRLMEQRVAKAT